MKGSQAQKPARISTLPRLDGTLAISVKHCFPWKHSSWCYTSLLSKYHSLQVITCFLLYPSATLPSMTVLWDDTGSGKPITISLPCILVELICCCMQRLTLDTLLHPGLQGHCTVACTHASPGSFASHSLLRCFLARFQTETLGMGGGAEEMKLQIRTVVCLLHIWYLGLMCEQFVRNSQHS